MFVPIADFALPAVRAGAADTRYRTFGSWGARVLALCIFLALVGIPSASAQISGAIGGTVADESGAVISGAKVIAKNMDTTAEREVTTETDGHYRFSSLPLGPYEVSATKQGFATEVRTGISVVVNEKGVVDLTLKIGSVTQQITVDGRRAAGERDHAGHFRTGGAAAGEGFAAQRAQLRFAAATESGDREFHFAEDRRHRSFQFHHGATILPFPAIGRSKICFC